MSNDKLDELRRKSQKLRSERMSDRIKASITAYRNAVAEIGQSPKYITAQAIELGVSEDLIDQAIERLNEAKKTQKEVKGGIIAQAYHLAESALVIGDTTEELANLVQLILTERVFLELQTETLVSVLRATNGERMAEAREALKQIDGGKYRELFGES